MRFDFTHPNHLACDNGWVDLQTGAFTAWIAGERPERRSLVAYNPRAKSAAWTGFLRELSRGDTAIRTFLQRFAGYAATGYTIENLCLLNSGCPVSGKTLFAHSLATALGRYAAQVETQTIADIGRRFTSSAWESARFIFCDSFDMSELSKVAPQLKCLIGGAAMTAEHPMQARYAFHPTCKLLLITNGDIPLYDPLDTTAASFRRRLHHIRFAQTLTQRRPDHYRAFRDIQGAGPAILAWIVAGAVAWNRSRFHDDQTMNRRPHTAKNRKG
jgi:putative DNA primase/helicase